MELDDDDFIALSQEKFICFYMYSIIPFFGCRYKSTLSGLMFLFCNPIIKNISYLILSNGIIVRSESQVKLFGIHIDQHFTFTYHIMEMCKKSIRPLACLTPMLDTKSKFMIFNVFVVSNFLYCVLVWHIYVLCISL